MEVRNVGFTFFTRAFELSIFFHVVVPDVIPETIVTDCMQTLVQICEFLDIVCLGWHRAGGIRTFDRLSILWLIFEGVIRTIEVLKHHCWFNNRSPT